MEISIHELTDDHFVAWSKMRCQLGGDDETDCRAAHTIYMQRRSENQAMNLIAVSETGSPLGFIESTLRTDYVEGMDTSQVWYVEGVYTEESSRRQGVATDLVHDLAKRVGAAHLASGCELTNEQSRLFHESIGFREVSRNIHFAMHLDEQQDV